MADPAPYPRPGYSARICPVCGSTAAAAASTGAGGVRGQVLGHSRLQGRLRVPVDGHRDLQGAGQHLLLAVRLDQLATDVLGEHRHVVVGGGFGRVGQPQWLALLPAGGGRGDHPEVGHGVQHPVAPLPGAGGVHTWVACRRRREQLGQGGSLAGVELRRRDAEVGQRGRIDAPRVLAEVDLVEVALEDLVLGHLPFEGDRDHRLADLAGQGAFRREVGVLHVLLGQRRPALRDAAGAEVGHHGPQQRGGVDPGVLVEAGVLGGDHRLAGRRGDLVEPHDPPVHLRGEAGDLVALAVQHDRRSRQRRPVRHLPRDPQGHEGEEEQQGGHREDRTQGAHQQSRQDAARGRGGRAHVTRGRTHVRGRGWGRVRWRGRRGPPRVLP